MASLISQMRNEQTATTMRQPSQQQIQLNQSIEQVRGMMQQLKTAQDPQGTLSQILQSNPALIGMLKSGNSLEVIAKQMARANNIDLNALIRQLQN